MALIKHGNNALSSVTAFPSAVPTGKPVLLSTATASASASIEFTSGIDSSYDIYQFEFLNIDPATNNARLMFNLSTDNGSNYNVTKTTTYFDAYHGENGAGGVLRYVTAGDLAQSTGDQRITDQIGNTDGAGAATMSLFNPSSTTYVKHFLTVGVQANGDTAPTYCVTERCGGYANTTSAVNAIIFRMDTGNISSGTIKMYGISA